MNMWSASIFIHLLPHDVTTALYSVRNDGLVDVILWQQHSFYQEQHALTIRSGLYHSKFADLNEEILNPSVYFHSQVNIEP
jgi:hypothetical protein